MAQVRMGRFAEPALWVLVALRRGPRDAADLLASVRSLDGPVRPAQLVGALARLERLNVVERWTVDRRPMYRLASESHEPAR